MAAWVSPPVPAGGFCSAPSMDIASTEPRATFGGVRRDDARVAELNNLRLALATFALQLDAFELRARGLLKTGMKPAIADLPPDVGGSQQRGRNDWSSIRSHGNKRGA
jgi:hypothetical protein